RYALRDESNKPVESVEEVFERVARVVGEAENKYLDGVKPEKIRQEVFQSLCSLKFVPNGRTLANAGTSYGQLANCFVLPIEDDLGRLENSIFATLRDAVMILQTGGGVGFSFGKLRHKGAQISTSKGKATGAVSFLKIYDTAFWVIGQGGGRRSACMAVLPVSHPDIFDFIRCKENEGEIEHFNISVGITDEFMQAVEEDKFFNLIDPHNQAVVQKVKARKIFDELANFAHHNGEPGVLFLDTANRENPVYNQYNLEATNPCGEQWLGPGENCCMASINLREHVKFKTNKGKSLKEKAFPYEVDWEKLKATVYSVTRFLDDVVDANKYVPGVPLLQEAAWKNRRIGVSIMGLADMFYLLGIEYGSLESEDVAGQIMEFIHFYTLKASMELAKVRGSFPGIIGSIYDKNNFKFKVNKPLVKPELKLKRPDFDWGKLLKDLKKYGIRNAALNTIAPTGAIATISGLEGYGCEPVFSLSYVMKTREGIEEISRKNEAKHFASLYYESQLFKDVLKRIGFSKNKIEEVFIKVRETGTCQSLEVVPKEIRKVFVVSSDLKAKQHVRMQAALQKFVDNSISKTINFPKEATVDEVKKAYILAWKLGCKGITVYVTGSREQVVLQAGKKEEKTTTPYVTNGVNDFRGKPLVKQRPGELSQKDEKSLKAVCPECGYQMTKGEGCMTCPACGFSKCDV
ncbi:adenosylcobalamin-dependent ribonucleoside-diphosphate reductase, partial [Candidatus Beckwithbacteria bacterium]|nr:adenosylcobalamin-dependent ribonucleoside-diphosphate reductase [Candidatus Beckwithbacteria bacterium]